MKEKEMDCNKIYKGDDTRAFGGNFVEIKLVSEESAIISKAVFQCGDIRKEFENPTFPLIVNLTSEESRQLSNYNNCYLAVYDEFGLKKTCKGTLGIWSNSEVVKDE